MFKRTVLFLCVCNSACATDLPPVTGSGVVANPVAAPAQPTASANSLFEMTKRIEQLQAEVQQLTGKVEEQAYHLEELKKQQKTMYTDFDDRLQNVENKSGSAGAAANIDKSAEPVDTPASPAVITSEPAPVAKSGTESTSSPAGNTVVPAKEVTPPATPSAPVSEAEKKDYQQAYDALRNGQTDASITQFNNFITNHPGSAYASNSKYWLGEAYRVNMNNAEAKKAFEDVVKTYPNSAKVPDALFKLGMIETEEKNIAKAREYFTRVTSEFANSRAAGLAQKKLQSLDGATP